MSWKDDARKRAKDSSTGKTFKLAEGPNTIRVLPNKEDPGAAPYIEFNAHREVGKGKRFLRCGKDLDGNGKCWLCDVKIPELTKSGSQVKREMGEAMKRSTRMLLQVSRYDPETSVFAEPKPWYLSAGGGRSMYVKVLKLLSSPRRSYEDPVKGYNFTIERTGTGFTDTNYGAPESDEEPSRVPKAILAKLTSLEKLAGEYSAEDQKAAYFAKEDDRGGGPRTATKKPKVEEDEEEVDTETEEAEEEEDAEGAEEEIEEEPEEEEEAEPAPKGKKKKTPEPEEEEEEEPAEEEEEPDAEEEEEAEEAEPEEEPDAEEEEPAPPKHKTKKKPAPKPGKKRR